MVPCVLPAVTGGRDFWLRGIHKKAPPLQRLCQKHTQAQWLATANNIFTTQKSNGQLKTKFQQAKSSVLENPCLFSGGRVSENSEKKAILHLHCTQLKQNAQSKCRVDNPAQREITLMVGLLGRGRS